MSPHTSTSTECVVCGVCIYQILEIHDPVVFSEIQFEKKHSLQYEMR